MQVKAFIGRATIGTIDKSRQVGLFWWTTEKEIRRTSERLSQVLQRSFPEVRDIEIARTCEVRLPGHFAGRDVDDVVLIPSLSGGKYRPELTAHANDAKWDAALADVAYFSHRRWAVAWKSTSGEPTKVYSEHGQWLDDLGDVLLNAETFVEQVSRFGQLVHSNNRAKGFYGEFEEKNFGERLAMVHEELSEALKAHRRGAEMKDDHLKERPAIEVELADAMIRILDMAAYYDLDVAGALLEKFEYNKKRPVLHGKRY